MAHKASLVAPSRDIGEGLEGLVFKWDIYKGKSPNILVGASRAAFPLIYTRRGLQQGGGEKKAYMLYE
jgi:hypothetical protein